MCDLLLIGIKSVDYQEKSRIIMNTYSKKTINENTVGIFICRSKDSLKKLRSLCKACHINNECAPLKKCKCKESKSL